MRIENITAKRLKDLLDEELSHLRSRFINIFNRYFEGSDVQKAVNIDRRVFLIKYMTLRSEMDGRGIKFFRETPIDREVYNRVFKRSIWELDVPILGDMVIVPDYVSVGGSFVKSPKDAEDIDIIIRDSEKNRDESFELKVGRLIREQTKKEPHFVYAPRGPHSSYIPVFDLTLRARDDTKKVRVKESIVAKELTPAQRKECDEETERIKENRKKAKWPHKFKPAKYTHPNGHPRCLICGDEEEVGGICHKPEDLEKGVRPAFGSPGGEKYLAHTIVSFIPEHKTYVEPFIGGGAVLFAKEPSENEIINDIDPEIAFAYRFIKNVTEDDLAELRKKDWKLTNLKFLKLKEVTPTNNIDKFHKFIMLRWDSFSSKSKKPNPLRLNQSWDEVNRLGQIKERLSKVRILNKDYKALKEFDSKESFFYLDPPYPETANFEDLQVDINELEKFVGFLKGKFILSLPDNLKNRKLFTNYELKKVKTGKLIDEFNPALTRTELLISNFPLKKTDIYLAKGEREYFEGLDNWDKDLKSDNAEVIKSLAEGSILDLGCGTCKLLKILSGTGREIAGVDRSDIALGYCKKREIETKKVDLEKDEIPFEDSSFDNVISVHTLEHLESPEKLIKDAYRVAKKRVIILSPLGERLDPTHKQEFKELKDFKKFFSDSWDIKEIEESNSAIAVLNISELKKAALAPFGRFTPPKPTMAGLTEAFSVEEIWNWAKDKFPLDVEEKLNGFRFIIEKAGDRVRLKTEGDKDRTKQLAPLAEALKKIPDDFIIDCSMGIERDGKALPRIRLMTLMADEPELEEGDVIKATMFDLPYWKEDLHEKPLSERRKSLEALYNKYLKGDPHFGLTSYNMVEDRKGLEQQFRRLAELPQSEGILIKTPDGKWDTDGSCETWAKIKREAEIKIIALERHDVKGGNYNYTCGLLPGDSGFENLTEFRGKKYINLGKCFNTKIKAELGDILTMGVEEIIPQEKKLQWLGARVIDIDKDRKTPYFAKQAMDIAERANILQKAEEGGIDYKVGDKGRGVLQLHIMGVEEEEISDLKKVSQEAVRSRHNALRLKVLLKGAIGEQGAHIDLRLVKTGQAFFEGGEIMIGNLTGLDKIKKFEQAGKLRFGWKVPRKEEPEAETVRGPVSWMRAGKGRMEIFPPGEVGATAHKYGAMLLLDSFTWEAIEPQDKHAKKFEFKGNEFIPEGTYLMAYVPVTAAGKRGERVWMISKLKEEEAEKQRQKLNSPMFAYKAIYEKLPEEPLAGRTDSPKKNWKGLEVDKHIKDEWLEQLNSIERIEIRSTDEGKSKERVAFVVFRMSDPRDDSQAEAVSEKLKRIESLYSLCDIGAGGRPRVVVAGKVAYGQEGWEEWWNNLAGNIQEALKSVIKLDIGRFRAEGIDEDMANPKKRYRELIADLRYLGNSGYPKLKAGEEWGEWTMDDILRYYAKIVDTLRSIYFPIIPPKLGDKKFNTSYWQCYREARKHMKSKPPGEEEAREWEKKRQALIKAAYKGIYLVEPHGKMIAEGTKKLIVKIKPLPEGYLNEIIYLCSAGKVYGTILIKNPKKISQEDFKSFADKHRITEKEATDWGFDKQEELLAYEFKIVDSYDPPREYHHPSGVQTVISEVRFKKSAMFRITKVDGKRQIVGGVVYEPDEVDTQGDYTDVAEIEKAMYRFMEKYATNTKRIRINHKGRKFFFPVLECFQPEHDTIKGDERLKAGSWWLMIKVTNKDIWKDIEEGRITGFSMGGRAKA